MRIFLGLVRLLLPLVVLYTLGYYVSGFSALTMPWLILLSFLIAAGEALVIRVLGGVPSRFGRIVIDFLVSTFVIFTVTLAIQGGQVPLGGALLAALIISLLHTLIPMASQVR